MIRRPTGRSGRRGFGRPGGRAAEIEVFDPFPTTSTGRAPRRPTVASVLARSYVRWVLASPDTRGLGTGLAALYPAGQLAHHYAAGDGLLLGAFAPPAALAAWVATYKTHGSPSYSGAIAAIVAGVPVWLATAATTGITNLPTLLGYTLTASTAWSAYTWSDVLKQRRRFAAAQAKWETIAGLAGLEGSRLLRTEPTRIGTRFKIDLGVQGPSAKRLASSDLAEQIARCYGIGTSQIRIESSSKNARIAWITIQLVDLWSQSVTHPATGSGSPDVAALQAAGAGKGHRSITDGPFIIGTDPETGDDLELVVFDDGGARHVDIVGSNGGGKTNVLSNIVQQAAECHDVLTVAIDLGKGVIPSLWKPHLHEHAGVNEEDKALEILAWVDALVDERAITCAGGTHQPSQDAPVVIVIVDEQDTATGMNSAVAAAIKPTLDKVHRRGRSGGVVMITAKQRDVVQHTGSKEGKANAYTTIVGRVANTTEMGKAVPDWMSIGCPDMSTYGNGTQGVVLLVRQGGAWQAGRSRALHDPATVTNLAATYGPADAHLEPHIAANLPGGYAHRHPTLISATTAGNTHGSPPPSRPDHDAPAPRPAQPQDHASGPRESEPSDAGGPEWGFDPADEAEVDKAAKGLVDRIDEFINETVTPPPPQEAVALDDLYAAKKVIDKTAVPEPVTEAIVALLTERGPRGARRDEFAERLNKSPSMTSNYLGALIKRGVITRAGQGKAGRYYLPDHTPDDHTE